MGEYRDPQNRNIVNSTEEIDASKESSGKNEVKASDDPHAGEESGIPGTDNRKNIGNAASGAGLGGNKGRGTADFPNQNS